MIKNRLGIKLPKGITQALVSGAGMFIYPVDFSKRPDHKEYDNFCSKCGSTRSHIHLGDGKYKCTYCKTEYYGQWKIFEKGDGRFEDLVFQIPNALKVDDEFFIQEDWNYCSIYSGHIIYRASFDKNYHSKKLVDKMSWKDASEMRSSQSRYNGVITGVEAKKVQEIYGNDKAVLMNTADELGYVEDDFKAWFNSQFDVKYEENPYVFLYKSEKIK